MLAIIGGSGLYQLDGLVVTEQHLSPPWLAIWPNHQGQYQDQQVLFLGMAKVIKSCPEVNSRQHFCP